ncbi:MAG: hypothetical protein ACOH18_03235 [Candidatus Saccharimonadaceae bacterium]
MWLKRLVGIVMIVTCVGMNALVLIGFFSPVKISTAGQVSVAPTEVAPMVTISAKPDAISAGTYSALSWTTTGNPKSCSASGNWTGPKTAFGAESTGRITTPGTYTYNLECTNAGGTSKASVSVAVGAASAPPPAAPKSNTSGSGSSGVTYCEGASPCYGPKEVASHNASGNCWGWNGNRVINITGLDAGYHRAKTGISSIEVSQICGKDLAPALGGNVSVENKTQDHKPTTKANADNNLRPYFVGYFDGKKP